MISDGIHITPARPYEKQGTRIAMHRCAPHGFTLIEIVVVISLIAIVLFLSIPRFHNRDSVTSLDDAARWLIAAAGHLKQKAIQHQVDYLLHIHIDAGRIWASHAAMTPEDRRSAMEEAFGLPDHVRIVNVEFPKAEKITHGTVNIVFYKDGYSDKVLLRMENTEKDRMTLRIEPFLSRIKTYDTHVEFDG